mmetsp:Transcript_51638/g.135554  ORF Transcript_51638/g.135554 Transcript_51638/m.135554 type:complete len:726 (-) Transcript_51638:45-2222(-)
MARMKGVARAALLATLCCALCPHRAWAEDESSNPLQKVVQLLGDLQSQVIKEGEETQKLYTQVVDACEDRSRELRFEIKTAKSKVEEQKATLDEETAKILAFTSKIEALASSQTENEAELKSATKLRQKEASTFAQLEKELVEQLDAIRRATSILTRQASSGDSFAQLSGTEGLVQALQAMVEANEVSSMDAQRLSSLLQTGVGAIADAGEEVDEDMDLVGAPAGATYTRKSGAVVDALESLQEKAEDQLDSARKAESNALANYAMKKQALEGQIKLATSDLAAAKQDLAASSERKAAASGELSSTTKDFKEDVKVLRELRHDCMQKATSFQEDMKSRNEELAALAKAKQVIKETTGSAGQQTYSMAQSSAQDDQALSFVQMKMKTKSADGSAIRAVHLVRSLSISMNSDALAQLASRIGSAMRASASEEDGADPFAKVRGLIQDMLAKLDADASEDARRKAYCDKELADTVSKVDDKKDAVKSLKTKVAQGRSASLKLKGEAAQLNKESGELMKNQAEMDRLRLKEKTIYEKRKPELERGVEGIKMALKVLKEYYAKGDDAKHDAQSSGATTIIGALEVIESDFSKQLAQIVSEEERAVREYKKRSGENEVSKAIKEQDVKYKTKQAASLDKGVADMEGDLSSTKEEYRAVGDYYTNIKKACSAKEEPYEQRKKAREQEIAGLNEALEILSNGASAASLVQRSVTHHTLRGTGARPSQLMTDDA